MLSPDELLDIIATEAVEASPVALPMCIEPTFITVDQEILRAVESALETGLEHTQAVLMEHDTRLGRTTRSNRQLALILEMDIRRIASARAKVRNALGWEAITPVAADD